MAGGKAIMMNNIDNVATVVEAGEIGSELLIGGQGRSFSLTVTEKIPFGFKVATKKIARGEKVIKYGEAIGIAIDDILPGQLVHVHNLGGLRGRGDLVDGNT